MNSGKSRAPGSTETPRQLVRRPSWKGEKVRRGDFLFIYPQSNLGEIISANFLRGRLRRHPREACGKALCPARRSDTIVARVRYFWNFQYFFGIPVFKGFSVPVKLERSLFFWNQKTSLSCVLGDFVHVGKCKRFIFQDCASIKIYIVIFFLKVYY